LATAHIEEKLKNLPAAPGCYLMKDAAGTVIYVGKAAVLRERVRSYFRSPEQLSPKNRGLVAHVADIEVIRLNSELEAFLTENDLIKKYRPKYNILLRDDKQFPYIKITNEPFPRAIVVRRVEKDGARYFGPYASAQSMNTTLDLLRKLFAYRTCQLNIVPEKVELKAQRLATARADAEAALPSPSRANHFLAPPTVDGHAAETHPSANDRACLDYYIHRCLGPCIGAVNQEEYGETIKGIVGFLEGRHEPILRHLEMQMDQAAEELNFERAAILRDQIRAVQRISERQRVVVPGGKDQDVIGTARVEDEMCVQIFHVREGHMVGKDTFTLDGVADVEDDVALSAFLRQYYSEAISLPEEVLLPTPPDTPEVLREWLSELRGKRVALEAPKIGDKRRLVEMVIKNAVEAAEERRLKFLTNEQRITQALGQLREALDLTGLPRRIECYDISNIQGTSAVGSMVVFEEGKPRTSSYRRFRIKTVEGSDDFAMMSEMLRRRLKRAGEWDPAVAASPSPADDQAAGADASALLAGDPTPLGGAEPRAAAPPPERTLNGASEQPVVPDVAEGDGDEEAGAAPSDWRRRPDLIIVDGGKGQLNAALAVLRELRVTDQPIVGLAKQQEEMFLPGRRDSIMLPRDSQGLFLLQRIRDEAHRFAITYHRNVRGKKAIVSDLDSIHGVGGRRKKALLQRFGSVPQIRKASTEEIAAVEGIGPRLASQIKAQLGG